ncbi:family 10 glycosylhydrolase [Sphaerisporangium sp. TRM90804]|uniref:glycoside hydrolase family 10 protein n=1 Tax=Sphaerisporangium sp. TRM90804 TaxID=3031113 RepID=UPI0024481E48|nr:family 10 glycosylhydrolase [Sphaerisporangium sp. TRM90804]MDH2427264.1 family 10 glycosylhydrolase [Sphaerisporangium sp. TRM90804]
MNRPPSRRAVLGGLAAASLAPWQLPARAAADSGPAPATAPAEAARVTRSPRRELRGMWIASVLNINWPSRPGLTPEQQRGEFVSWLDLARAQRLNAVFVQVRPTADAFWPSPYEPWSEYLTGVQGRNPGYDPLAFMVQAAHQHGLALHAWFNPYRVSTQPDPARLAPEHPLRRHPSWGVVYAGRLYYNPGLPEVRAFVQDAIMDAVKRYDVDGVHFDDYFYPYPVAGQRFDDDAAFAEHGGHFTDRAAWRRNNVDLLIHEMARKVYDAKPEVAWGVSPFGIWRNVTTDPRGSSSTGSQSYDDQHADTRAWVKNGWLDYVAPQIYWNLGLPVADYAALAPWWAQVVHGTGTQLWVGQAAYKVGAAGQPAAWQDPAELSRHLTFDKDYPDIGGDVYYSAGDVRADRLGAFTRLREDHYARPALAPVLSRLAGGPAPARPALTALRRTEAGVELGLAATGHSAPRLYAVYRLDAPSASPTAHNPGQDGRADDHDWKHGYGEPAGHLIAVVPGARRARYTDPAAPGDAYYRVTAVDPANRQSLPTPWHRAR